MDGLGEKLMVLYFGSGESVPSGFHGKGEQTHNRFCRTMGSLRVDQNPFRPDEPSCHLSGIYGRMLGQAEICIPFLDDTLVFSRTLKDVKNVRTVLQLLRQH